MKLPAAVLAILLIGLLEVAFYFANPFRIPSYDPRLRLYGITLFRSPSTSMAPAIADGDFFVVSAWHYLRHNPAPGDIVAFQYPPDPSIDYVKRVIACCGARVEMRNGVVLVNDKVLSEPYLPQDRVVDAEKETMPPVWVPQDSYFVLGDNRANSADSRYWGLLPRSNILGRVSR